MHELTTPLLLLYILSLPLQVVTGHQPFKHTNRDAVVIQEVLRGNRPERPTVGFSDMLWALLVQMWLEEYESSPPVRPNITSILRQLEGESKTWSPTSGLLAPPTEQRADGMPSLLQNLLKHSLPKNHSDKFHSITGPFIIPSHLHSNFFSPFHSRFPGIPTGKEEELPM